MKPKSSLGSFLNLAKLGLIPMAVLVCNPNAQAVEYWWDNNGDTAGFGTAAGTWAVPTTNTLSTSNTGETTALASVTTTDADNVTFGTNTVGAGLAGGTINVDGTGIDYGPTTFRLVKSMTFGSQNTGDIIFNSINGGKLITGNASITNNSVNSDVIFNADLKGYTLAFRGHNDSNIILNGDYFENNTTIFNTNLQVNGTWTNALTKNLTFRNDATFQVSSNSDIVIGNHRTSSGSNGSVITKDTSTTSTLLFAVGQTTTSADNEFGGKYSIQAGTMQWAKRNALYAVQHETAWTAANIQVANTGVFAVNVGGADEFTTTDVTTLLTNLGGANGTSTTGFAAGSAIGLDTTNAAGGTFTVADVIADSTGTGGGALGVRKLGTGELVLTNANTYTGATNVNGGTLRAGAAAGGQAFGNGSAVTLANMTGATLDLNGFNQTIGSLAGGGATGGNVALGADATLTTGSNNTSTTYAGAISGTGTSGLTKTGNGKLTLTGVNTYTGATLVSAGTLLVNGSLGNSAVTVNGGAFGGSGTIGSTLDLVGGSFNVVDLFDALQVTGTITLYAGFGIDDLAGLIWGSVADGTYTLIDGTLDTGVFAGLANNSLGTAYDIGGGRSAYFQEGSLQLVVIPEPRAALLGSLGLLALLRRRRS